MAEVALKMGELKRVSDNNGYPVAAPEISGVSRVAGIESCRGSSTGEKMFEYCDICGKRHHPSAACGDIPIGGKMTFEDALREEKKNFHPDLMTEEEIEEFRNGYKAAEQSTHEVYKSFLGAYEFLKNKDDPHKFLEMFMKQADAALEKIKEGK